VKKSYGKRNGALAVTKFLTRLADRLVLQPSRQFVDPENRRREIIATEFGEVEAWVCTNFSPTKQDLKSENAQPVTGAVQQRKSHPTLQMIGIKFPGTAGRAERGGPHPLEVIPEFPGEIWTFNPIGYGGSHGRASLLTTARTCEGIWKTISERFPGLPILVIGNSLGCLSALYLAARKKVQGVYLRNPVPLQQMIQMRLMYNWWNFGMAKMIARKIPVELDAIENAQQAKIPLFMTSSERDRQVPVRFQRLIFDAYAAEKTLFVLKQAGHSDPVPEDQVEDYKQQLKHFLEQLALAKS
jgi:uncharacterized protein